MSKASSVDSLISVYQQNQDSWDAEELAGITLQISDDYREANNYTKAIEYSTLTIEYIGEYGNANIIRNAYFILGSGFSRLGEYEKAIENYEKGIEFCKGDKREDQELLGKLYNGIAIAHKSLGNYENSYDIHIKGLKIMRAINDSIGIATALYETGSLFFYQGQFEKALKTYKDAQPFTAVKGGDRMAFCCLAAMGTTYENLDSLELALKYNRLSLDKAMDMNDLSGISYSLSNVGSTYMTLKQYDKAYDYLRNSLNRKKELGDRWGQTGTLRTIGHLFIQKDEPEKAVPFLEEALDLSYTIKSKTRQIEILSLLSKAHREMEDFEKSLSYLELHAALKDSVLNETTLKEMGDLKKNYEIEQKENEILLLKKDNQLLEVAQEKDKLYNYLWIMMAVILAIFGLFFVSRYRAQKQSSELLRGKNAEINRQNGELQKVNDLLSSTNKLLEDNKKKIEEQNKALESSNEDLRNFASVASHDLKEPLRMINSYTSILKRKYENMFDDRAHEFMGYVIDGVTRMEQLINSLLDYSRVTINGGVEKLKLINLRDVAEVVKGNLRYPITQRNATVTIENGDNFPIVKANQIQMMQLIQNLVSNALKFTSTERPPEVIIGFTTEGSYHTFYVKDNGIGISKENQEKIFDMLTRLHTKQEYEGTGIGLATVRKIVERHNGRIWVESQEGFGSTFFFTLPVVKEAVAKLAEQQR